MSIRLFGWRSCFIIISFVVFIAAVLIRNVYEDPDVIVNIGQQSDSNNNIELEPIGSEVVPNNLEFIDIPINDSKKQSVFDKIHSFFTYLLKPIIGNRNTDNDTDDLAAVSTIWKQGSIAIVQRFKSMYTYMVENKAFSSIDFAKYSRQYKSIFTTCPKLLLLCITYFFINLISYSYFFWLPFYLTTQLNYDSELAADLSMIFDFGGFLGIILTSLTTEFFPASKSHGSTRTSYCRWMGMVHCNIHINDLI